MTRVVGIGGVFFKAKDPATLKAWYLRHLGIDAGQWGATFHWDTPQGGAEPGATVWSVFTDTSTYYPGPFMINYRVLDLPTLLTALRAEGCNVDDKMHDDEFGKFGWVTDPEGNRIELWQPPPGRFPG